MRSKGSVFDAAVSRTRLALESNRDAHWILGFSGGKDSTALLKIFCVAANKVKNLQKKIDVIYCDTGVENPALDLYVKRLFSKLKKEFLDSRSPFQTHILRAPVKDRFFVKIIGRGYPPPTNSFRWCTKSLRIRPVAEFIANAAADNAVVSLGLRRSESQQRDRSRIKAGGEYWQVQREGTNHYRLFLPILDMTVAEVWDTAYLFPLPRSIDVNALAKLYQGASGECPLIKSPLAPPCATGRFGCWTCTVVRKDRSAISLIESGYSELIPFLEFRDWLATIRNETKRRWPQRRRGTPGLGPFTMNTRREILARVRKLERKVSKKILSSAELREIQRLWRLDRQHPIETNGRL
jgi:DNA sulfur modification protein DndC